MALQTHLRVIVGEHNRSASEATETSWAVKQIYMHPNYNNETQNYDVALIRIDGNLEYCLEVSPLCLADTDIEPGTQCVVTGWGQSKGRFFDACVHIGVLCLTPASGTLVILLTERMCQ